MRRGQFVTGVAETVRGCDRAQDICSRDFPQSVISLNKNNGSFGRDCDPGGSVSGRSGGNVITGEGSFAGARESFYKHLPHRSCQMC
jgi:hypothetical protein